VAGDGAVEWSFKGFLILKSFSNGEYHRTQQ